MQAEFDRLVYTETPQGGSYMPADQSHVTLSLRYYRALLWVKSKWPRRRRSECRFRKSRNSP